MAVQNGKASPIGRYRKFDEVAGVHLIGGIVARLAQASIRIRSYELDEPQFERLSAEIDAIAARAARETYGPSVEVDVVVEAGSLLIRITVIGSILWGAYDAVSKYPDFKAGLKGLIRDSQQYGTAIADEVFKITGRKPDTVVKRDMTPGRISRVIERLEKIKELEKQTSKRAVQEALRQAGRDFRAIERDITNDELKQVDEALESERLPRRDKLPRPTIEEEKSAISERRKFAGASLPKGKRLRHHNRFVVGDKTPRFSKSKQ